MLKPMEYTVGSLQMYNSQVLPPYSFPLFLTDRSYFFIHSSNLCLLIGEFNLFIFKAITDKERLTSAILLFFSVYLISFPSWLPLLLPSFVFIFLLCTFWFPSHFLFCIFLSYFISGYPGDYKQHLELITI